jgi:hypothetical protein
VVLVAVWITACGLSVAARKSQDDPCCHKRIAESPNGRPVQPLF